MTTQNIVAMIAVAMIVGALLLVIAWKYAIAQDKLQIEFQTWRLYKIKRYPDNQDIDLSYERFLNERRLKGDL